jgi:hypothetical protein
VNGYRKYLLAPPALAILIFAVNWNTMSDDDQQPVSELDKPGIGHRLDGWANRDLNNLLSLKNFRQILQLPKLALVCSANLGA